MHLGTLLRHATAHVCYMISCNCRRAQGQFRGQKGLGPLEKLLEMPNYVLSLQKKLSPALQNTLILS
jgi:hypothetical protein